MVSDDDLRYAMENSSFAGKDIPGKKVSLNIPGTRGRYQPGVSDGFANYIGYTRLTEENADETITKVIDHFKKENSEFVWMTSDLSTPTNLNQRLENAGLTMIANFSGLCLRDLNTPIRSNPEIEIRELQERDLDKAIDLLVRAYPTSIQEAEGIMYRFINSIHARIYLAYVPEHDEPVASSVMFYSEDNDEIACLQGAATVPDYRGRGIYTSLMARRIRDAKADGKTAATMQANKETSAPICKKLGFEELLNLDLFIWEPEKAG